MPRGGARKGAGRKPYKKSDRLSRVVGARVTEQEEREILRKAKEDGKDLADWIRDRLLDR